jgi:beta-galactosidase
MSDLSAVNPVAPNPFTLSLDQGWLFGGVYQTGSEAPAASTEGWGPVDLPHCVVPLSWRNWDPATWQKLWIYRRALDIPALFAGRRIFLDFEGALTSTTPYINGSALPQSSGGYLPFSYEITKLVTPGANQLAVVVDGTWQPVPPDGNPKGAGSVDYLEPAGIYRHVSVRAVPTPAYLFDAWVSPSVPATGPVTVPVVVRVDTTTAITGYSVLVQLCQWGGQVVVASAQAPLAASSPGPAEVTVTLANLDGIARWDLDQPNLYSAVVSLVGPDGVVDNLTVRTGFRQAEFQPDGFYLNGRRVVLFGLNRHQLFPYAGMAMPDRAQRRDAEILRTELNCQAVRCSHYPQSRAFLDACDELGMVVWQETPGWGYIGGTNWQELWFNNVAAMVARDRSRPSVVIWGVQPNETQPPQPLANQAKTTAKAADAQRPSAGTMTVPDWPEYVQDVYAYDDYTTTTDAQGMVVPKLHPPIAGKPYLVTESVGAIEGIHYFRRGVDSQSGQQAQALLHGLVHSQAQDPALTYAGLLGWAAFDYQSLCMPCWYAIKTPGVLDTFRNPKPGAAIYQSQVGPGAQPVIQPSFYWDFGPTSPVTSLKTSALVWSNCDELVVFLDGKQGATLAPAVDQFPNLGYPPFVLDTTAVAPGTTPELRLDGYVGGNLVLSRQFAGDTAGDCLLVRADDAQIAADGSDATRVWFMAVDRYGAPRPYVQGNVTVSLEGPGVLVGDTTFDFADAGGSGAVWLRSAAGEVGVAVVRVSHPTLGQGQVEVVMMLPTKEVEMFVRDPGSGEICLCSPAGAFNLGNDWPAVQAAYQAAGVPLVLIESATLLARFSKIALHQ